MARCPKPDQSIKPLNCTLLGQALGGTLFEKFSPGPQPTSFFQRSLFLLL
jgi:hypothetical protein